MKRLAPLKTPNPKLQIPGNCHILGSKIQKEYESWRDLRFDCWSLLGTWSLAIGICKLSTDNSQFLQ